MNGYTPFSNRYPPWPGSAVVAVAAGVAGVLGSYAMVGFRPGFVVAPVESALSRLMPGAVVSFAITTFGDLGQQLNLLFAASLVVALYALLVGLAVGVGRRLDSRWVPTVGSAALVWAATALLTARPFAAVGAALGVGVVVAVTDLSLSAERFVGHRDASGRRRVLSGVLAAVGASLLGFRLGEGRATPSSTADSAPDGDVYGNVDPPSFSVDDQLTTAYDRSFDVDGLESLISAVFYRVDISSVDPSIDASRWTLSVTGGVEEELTLTYDDLREMDHEHRFVTLRCVGEALNGKKMDTALWSGVPIAPIIEEAGPTTDCNCVKLHAADGYYQQFPLEALRPGLLALGMNGEPLPRAHGAPARVLVPGHWGEVNVKWLSEIEFVHEEEPGYWEQRGWHGTGPVKTVAKLHATNRLDDGRIQVGGHAYAGTRGIGAVEVSTDGGDTWESADLTDPLPGPTGPAAADREQAADAWRQWQFAYDPPQAVHEVAVRARDGTGELQPEERTGARPDGAGGWVRESVDPTEVG